MQMFGAVVRRCGYCCLTAHCSGVGGKGIVVVGVVVISRPQRGTRGAQGAGNGGMKATAFAAEGIPSGVVSR